MQERLLQVIKGKIAEADAVKVQKGEHERTFLFLTGEDGVDQVGIDIRETPPFSVPGNTPGRTDIRLHWLMGEQRVLYTLTDSDQVKEPDSTNRDAEIFSVSDRYVREWNYGFPLQKPFVGIDVTSWSPSAESDIRDLNPFASDEAAEKLIRILEKSHVNTSAMDNARRTFIRHGYASVVSDQRIKLDLPQEDITPIVRNISSYERAYTVGDTVYIVWSQGERAGEIYRTVTKPTDEELARIPSMDEITTQIHAKLENLNRFKLFKDDLNPKYGQAKADLYIYLHTLYYGTDTTPGLEIAQLFDLDGEGEKYGIFLRDIQTKGYREYLQNVADEHGFENVFLHKGGYTQSREEIDAYDMYFSQENMDEGEDDTIGLIHYSTSATIPGFIEMGGLASDEYRNKYGLSKEAGESKMGSAQDYWCVSFWPTSPRHKAGFVKTSAKTGFGMGLEYPIAWGISKENASQLPLEGGTIYGNTDYGEKTVHDFVNVTHLWVPPFAVESQKKLLQEHGLGHIQVRPFLRKKQ